MNTYEQAIRTAISGIEILPQRVKNEGVTLKQAVRELIEALEREVELEKIVRKQMKRGKR